MLAKHCSTARTQRASESMAPAQVAQWSQRRAPWPHVLQRISRRPRLPVDSGQIFHDLPGACMLQPCAHACFAGITMMHDPCFRKAWIQPLNAQLSIMSAGLWMMLARAPRICDLQEFYTLRADPDVSKAAKASPWDTLLPSTAPPYGATCMDFHKVVYIGQLACIMGRTGCA